MNRVYEDAVDALPKLVRDRVKGCPVPGHGINPWCLSSALSLTSYFENDEIVGILEAYVKDTGRERDIERAVSKARAIANGEMGGPNQGREIWPAVDHRMAHDIVVNSNWTLAKMREASPPVPSSEDIIDSLFPGNPLLCFGRRKNIFATQPRESWRGKESTFEFIVPNRMKAVVGKTQEGKDSARCLDNTGEREFLVVEFDIAEAGDWEPYVKEWRAKGISTFDAQTSLLVHLATKDVPRLSLLMAVHSGKKSIHGWYSCKALEERQTRAFMERAVRLGADKATWTLCQFVRMPDGMRDNGNRQRVHYFAAGVIHAEGGAK
jgi:hypothetical protein